MNTRRWQWGHSMARALLLAVTFAGQLLGIGGKEAEAQEKFVPAGPEIDRANANLVTNIYQVPESALSRTPDGIYFTSPVELLSHAGVAFPKGSSAIFQGTSRQLIVRNTADELKKVEVYLESLIPAPPKQVHFKATFVTSAERLFTEKDDVPEPVSTGLISKTFFLADPAKLEEVLSDSQLDRAIRDAARADDSVRAISDAAVGHRGKPVRLAKAEFAALLSDLKRGKIGGEFREIIEEPGGYLLSGKGSLLMQAGGRGIGVASTVIGADDFTLDVEIVAQGRAYDSDQGRRLRRLVPARATVWTDSTIVFERYVENDGTYEYDFVTATIVDAAGNPLHTEDEGTPQPMASDLPKVEVITAESESSTGEGGKVSGELPLPATVFVPLPAELVEDAEDDDLYTNVYQVPPTFLSAGAGGVDQRDPFANPEQPRVLQPLPTAREILERAGITFGEGASAIYRPAGSQLIVRNTLDQMELVEVYIESFKGVPEKQIYLRTHFLETDRPLFEDAAASKKQPKKKANDDDQVVGMKVDSRREMAEVLADKDVASAIKARALIANTAQIVAVLDEPELQALIKKARDNDSWDVVEGENVMLRSGQGARVIAAGDRGVGLVEALIGEEDLQINLQLMVQYGTIAGSGRHRVGELSIVIWDGKTVVSEHQTEDGRYRYDFITARLLDPAGMPWNGDEKIKQAERKEIESWSDEEKTPEQETAVDVGELSAEDVNNVREADAFALRGSQLMAQEQYAACRDLYLKALQVLPKAELTRDREKAYVAQFLAAMRAAIKED